MKYDEYLQTEYWQEVSKAVKAKAGWKCQICNSPHDLNAHHRTYEHRGNELEHLEDMTCLCRRCHANYHGKGDEGRTYVKVAKTPRKGHSSGYYNHERDMPYGDPIVLNKKLIDRLRTRYGGFTGASLASIGVRRYPLKKNWWKHFLGAEISRDTYYNALLGREIYRGGR